MRRPAVGRGGGAAVEATLVRLVLLDDEVQEISAKVMSKIRILSAESFDSRSLLTVVLAGNGRPAGQLRSPELLPLESRVRTLLILQPQTNDELVNVLRTVTDRVGNPQLMTDELMLTLAQHSHGNLRAIDESCRRTASGCP